MELLDSFLIWIAEFLGDHLYEGIFLAALLETIIPPIPTLAIFPTAGFLASQQGITLLGLIPIVAPIPPRIIIGIKPSKVIPC